MSGHPSLPPSETDAVVRLTQQLVGFDTINPPGQERQAMRFCAAHLATLGFDCRVVDHDADAVTGAGRASLIATRGRPDALCFSGHLDTVPLGRKAWTRPPHGGVIEGDLLYGRGSSDMKGGVAAFMLAVSRSTAPATIILTAGEETGCDGARWLAGRGDLPRPRAMIVGESTDNAALAGHKGVLWLRLTAQGRTAHGATPELGVNAIHRMAPTLTRLCAFQPEGAHPLMGRTSANLGTLQAGINVNSVPDQCSLTVDLRSVAGVGHDALRAAVAALCDPDIAIETLLDLPAVWTDPQGRWFADAARRVMAISGTEPARPCATYFTDASVLRPAMGDPPVMILGPGAVDQPHGTDEYVRISRLAEAVRIYTELLDHSG